MRRRRALLALVLGPPMCGVLIAGLLFAGWTAIGSPSLAGGAVWLEVTKTGDSHFTGAPDQPFFVLALGNDARDDSEPGLGDAIHVIGVNPAQGKATILDIPRDTEGPNRGKINAYNSLSGLRAQADAVSQVVGVPIPYAITANFPGFVGMVDEVGGIDINVPEAVNDDGFSGANFQAGMQHMNGDQALAYSRDRHSFSNGDITRTNNQGLVILAALSTLEAKHPTAADTIHLVATLGKHVKLDGVSVTDIFRMARLALTINPASIRNVTIPVTSSTGTNLVPTGDARSLFADFADDAVLESH